MGRPLSTISSNLLRLVGGLVVALTVVFAADRLMYFAFFRIYDKPYHLSRVEEKADILVVGASNILWGVDSDLMSARMKQKVVILSIPGGDMEFRWYMLKDYLDKHTSERPRLVVLQTDRYFLNRGRYPAGAYKAIEGYFHRDILRAYIAGKWDMERYGGVKRVFKTHSINSQFYLIASTYYQRMWLPSLAPALNAEPAVRQDMPVLNSADAAKVEEWKKQYTSVDDSIKIDPDYEMYFRRAVEALQAADVETVFLETPIYNMFGTKQDEYEEVRDLLRSAEGRKIRYLRIKDPGFENDLSLYFDASHLNLKGRARYTMDLMAALESR